MGRLLFNMVDANLVGDYISPDWWLRWGLYVGVAIVAILVILFGTLALKLMDSALKILTPFVGSFMLTAATAYYVELATHRAIFISLRTFFRDIQSGNGAALQSASASQYALYSLIGWLALFMLGVFVQFQDNEASPADTYPEAYYYGNRKETDMRNHSDYP